MLYVVLFFAIVTGNPTCAGLEHPVGGPVIEPFAPIGRYAGHWGIDFGVPSGTAVGAADAGVVTVAGVVVGNRTVTIDHGGVKTSYSFLTLILTSRGATVGRGQVIAVSGHHGGRPSVHFSVRIRDVDVDPEPLLVCRGDPGPGLWLR
jgi:murein DD-endopeptidase MepM/ murein hydrolase activator NlpD